MRRVALVVLILLILAADQGTKALAREKLRVGLPRHFGVLTLVYAENTGAFLSLGENFSARLWTAVFDIVVAIGLLAAAIVLFRGKWQRGDDLALAAIISGGVGNLIDRLRFAGRVTDFSALVRPPGARSPRSRWLRLRLHLPPLSRGFALGRVGLDGQFYISVTIEPVGHDGRYQGGKQQKSRKHSRDEE